jgi:hypothetical protein
MLLRALGGEQLSSGRVAINCCTLRDGKDAIRSTFFAGL